MLLSESAPTIAGKMYRRGWTTRNSVSEFFILFFLLTVTTIFSNGVSQQQYFRVVPKDVRVQEGGEAVLECEVGNLEGRVQWTKDGFGLGSDSIIPGHPSYSMQTDRASGVFNLRIRNVTLADDAEFQCQVGPYHYHKPIRAHARLTVIAPPSSVEIVGHMPNEKIEIRENTPLTLECVVRNSRPAAQIEWYRGRVPLKIDAGESSSSQSDGESPDGRKVAKRHNVTSHITITPTSDDDFAEFSCQAKHEALAPDMPMRTSVQLSVLYPPGPPYIEGYTTGENFRRGQTVELVCRSRGGNPPAQLVWWRGKEILRSSYRTIGRSGPRVSENTLTFEAQPSDDGATLRCEATNAMVSTSPGGTKQKMSAEVKLSVLFAPTHVTITGPTEARVGEPVPLTCVTGASNPAAEIKWMVGGRQWKNSTFRTIPANSPEAQALHFGPGRGNRQRNEGNGENRENNDTNEESERDSRKLGKGGETESNGGWITISNITAIVSGSHRRSLVVICHGLNMQLTENVVGTHTINILYPPSQPMIHGYTEGVPIEAGTVQRISCVSTGGNPLATISWFKNGKKVFSVTRVTETSVSAEVSIVTNASDNGAVYRCEASNSATEVPLSESITLNVHFAPENVKIRTEPSRLRTGQEASLTCESSSSNPPAHLTWWRDGIPIPQDNRIGNAGDGDGAPGNGTTITRSGLDGGRVSVSVLYLGKANAALAGASFACQASNEALDKSVHDTITLQILYKPKFVEKMEGEKATIVVAEGESTNVTLLAEGNPPDITYTWTKDGAPLKSSRDSAGRQRVTWDGPTLNLTNALREDAGKYTVEAVNSEGSDTTSIVIDVHYPPSIYELPRVVVVSKNEDALLSCSADGNPLPEGSVHWRREGNTHPGGGPAVTWSLIPPGGTVAPHTGEGRIIPTFYPNGTSILRIQRAESKDAGPYVCVASNGVGQGPLVSKSTFLIVKHAPEMDPSPGAWKAASSLGGSARLVCRARGAPKPNFSWSFNGAAITPSISTSSSVTSSTSSPQSTAEASSEKYQILYHEVDPSTWESVLVVRGVRLSDYGAYECGANNELGSFTANAVLSPASRPDPPVSLSVRNATHDSVLLTWVPGFDGGARVAFQIRYKKIGTVRKSSVLSDKGDDGNGGETLASLDDHSQEKKEDIGGPYYYVDVTPPGVTSFAVTGLSPSTEYAFSIMAKNRLGNSDYSGPPLRVTTTSHVPSSSSSSSSKAPSSSSSSGTNSSTSTTSSGQLPKLVIVVVTVVGAALLVLNVVLIVCFVRRRTQKKRRLAAAASEQGSSKSATIEMYASSYNETVTGETLSSISEKSESYSNGGDSNEDYIEDSTKPAASTYLIDQIEPPSQYAYQAPPAATMHLHSHPHHHHHHLHASHGTLRQQQQIPGDGTLSRRKPASNAYMMHTPMDGQGVVDTSAGSADHSSLDRNEDDVGGSFVDTLRRNPYSHGMGGVIPPPMSEQHQAYYSGLSPDNPYTANAVYPPAPLGFGPTPPMSTTSSAPTSIAPPLVVVGNGSLPPDVTMMAPYPYLGGGATYSTKGTIPRSGARPSPIGPTPPSSSASSSPPPPPPPPLPALSTFSPSSMVVGGGQNPDMEGHLV